jgi:tetratricopeptide (TPR) repeat protein
MISALRRSTLHCLVAMAASVAGGLMLGSTAMAEEQDRTWCYGENSNPDHTIAGCTALIKSGRDLLATDYYNRGIAWRRKGDIDRSIADYTEAIRIDPNHTGAYKNRGRANFFAGNYDAAASDLARGVQEAPDDAYAVVWLYLARARSGSKGAAAELETKAAKLSKQSDWPYPVAELFLGRRPPEATLSAPSTQDDRCEAHFYVGEWHLLQGNPATAAAILKIAADSCPKNFIEYTGAQAELNRLKPYSLENPIVTSPESTKAASAQQPSIKTDDDALPARHEPHSAGAHRGSKGIWRYVRAARWLH